VGVACKGVVERIIRMPGADVMALSWNQVKTRCTHWR
jgi:hypothetical protein